MESHMKHAKQEKMYKSAQGVFRKRIGDKENA